MNYAVIYSSSTGNTRYLAEALKEKLGDACIQLERVKDGTKAEEADGIFAGFWTDKGDCEESMAKFLETLRGKRVFLFGTAGFGQSDAYFERILSNVKMHLDASNTVIGSWMCQGRMPMAVRRRYEGMMEQDPGKARQLIFNFDEALKHPDTEDMEALWNAVSQSGMLEGK